MGLKSTTHSLTQIIPLKSNQNLSQIYFLKKKFHQKKLKPQKQEKLKYEKFRKNFSQKARKSPLYYKKQNPMFF